MPWSMRSFCSTCSSRVGKGWIPRSCRCSWWMVAAQGGSGRSFPNKLGGFPDRVKRAPCGLSLRRHGGGEGCGSLALAALSVEGIQGMFFEAASWSIFSAVRHRPSSPSPLTVMAEGRLLQALAPAVRLLLSFRCCCSFNLPVFEPKGRPFLSLGMATIVSSVPSGFVPGDGEDGRVVKLQRKISGGPDCFFYFLVRVILVNFEGCAAIFCSFEDLNVTCIPAIII